jgi:hypothetical protein
MVQQFENVITNELSDIYETSFLLYPILVILGLILNQHHNYFTNFDGFYVKLDGPIGIQGSHSRNRCLVPLSVVFMMSFHPFPFSALHQSLWIEIKVKNYIPSLSLKHTEKQKHYSLIMSLYIYVFYMMLP